VEGFAAFSRSRSTASRVGTGISTGLPFAGRVFCLGSGPRLEEASLGGSDAGGPSCSTVTRIPPDGSRLLYGHGVGPAMHDLALPKFLAGQLRVVRERSARVAMPRLDGCDDHPDLFDDGGVFLWHPVIASHEHGARVVCRHGPKQFGIEVVLPAELGYGRGSTPALAQPRDHLPAEVRIDDQEPFRALMPLRSDALPPTTGQHPQSPRRLSHTRRAEGRRRPRLEQARQPSGRPCDGRVQPAVR